jgi:hypothetical protein
MTEHSAHDHQNQGIDRKILRIGTALAGAGVVAAPVGGKLMTTALADARHARSRVRLTSSSAPRPQYSTASGFSSGTVGCWLCSRQ